MDSISMAVLSLNSLKKLGASCDWDPHTLFTMDEVRGMNRSLKHLWIFNKGLIYQRYTYGQLGSAGYDRRLG